MSEALAPEAEAAVAAAVGRWPDPPVRLAGPLVPDDPLRAVAERCDVPATGSGALDGARVVVKDNIAVAGVPLAFGSGLPGFVPARDATVVARVRAAGGRIVAKAQCEAFLLGANSFSSRPEAVRNPYGLRRSAGGSSSGSGALVAAGLARFAIGSDSGGSIRIPAAFCGVVGLKPSRGRIPCTGASPMDPLLSHVGPIARTVADVARLFAVLDGSDGVDPRQAWSRRERTRGIGGIADLRIGVLDDALMLADEAVGVTVTRALARLEAAGARNSSLTWSDRDEALELHLAIHLLSQVAASGDGGVPGFALTEVDGWAAWRSGVADDELPPALLVETAAGRALLDRDPGLHGRAARRAEAIASGLDHLLADVDVLVLPTVAGPPPMLPDGEVSAELAYGDTRLTAPFNVTGHPALSLPAGMTDGLPVGLQLVAKRGHDDALLAAALFIERELEPIPAPSGDFGEPL